MARTRVVEQPPPPPLRPPRELVAPTVEDYVSADEYPTGGVLNVLDRHPDEDTDAWRYRQMADQRYRLALAVFRDEHRGRKLDLTMEESRRWLAGEGPVWRDREAFLARSRS